MAGLDLGRLVLVKAQRGAEADQSCTVGTGYFVRGDLVLTASHVVPEEGLTLLEVRTEADGKWRRAHITAAWRDAALDAVLIRIIDGLGDEPELRWAEQAFAADTPWHSTGYPLAANVVADDAVAWKSIGLAGTLHAQGGGGQGQRELDLSVDAPPPAEQWPGISGAPVFVGDQLGGIVKEAPASFKGVRLAGVPATSLLQRHGFRIAISEPWHEVLPARPWVLVVGAEAKGSELGERVDGALRKDMRALESVIGGPIEPLSIKVRITEALQSPGRWLRFVKLLCAAPIAVFDATGWEPGLMLALGVRAVVHRGVTITSTSDELTETYLASLPFNLKETKLVHHGAGYEPKDDRHPHRMIATAIKKGWQELRGQPRYLDLPAYDGVRCPYPDGRADDPGAVKRVLVLCPFGADYGANWLHLSNALADHFPGPDPVRMLDIASPRLVGQALYESIRWARTCVVDWTGWRPNVFFEFGARLACAEVGPVVVIYQAGAAAAQDADALEQRSLLMTLFAPARYEPGAGLDVLQAAFRVHDANLANTPPPVPSDRVPHDATYRTCVDAFEWPQEGLTSDPHDALRRSVQEPFGNDPQAAGRAPVLFSTNPAFSRELERSVRERWIAAWYYLSQRRPRERWAEDAVLRSALRKLGNEVLQFGLRDADEPHLLALRDTLYEVLDELDDLDQQHP